MWESATIGLVHEKHERMQEICIYGGTYLQTLKLSSTEDDTMKVTFIGQTISLIECNRRVTKNGDMLEFITQWECIKFKRRQMQFWMQ